MLKMKCSQCDEVIVSALLADIDEINCEHCQALVPVKDVLVFAEGFTFHRNDLLKRLFRYKTLFDEISKEREMLEKNPEASAESKKSLDRFSQALAEVMAGARKNLRIDFSDRVPLVYRVNKQAQSGFLANLSMTGARVDLAENSACPRKKCQLTIEFNLPGSEDPFFLTGSVSWQIKNKAFGIEFQALEQNALDALWDYISSSVRAPSSET